MTHPTSGSLIGLARHGARGAPMEEMAHGLIVEDYGLTGDNKAGKSRKRQITVLAKDAWEATLMDLAKRAGSAVVLPWTTRRANLYVADFVLPQAPGGFLHVGPVTLEITGCTDPCSRMDKAYPGLMTALYPDWRGGVTCRVIAGGTVRLGDPVRMSSSPSSA